MSPRVPRTTFFYMGLSLDDLHTMFAAKGAEEVAHGEAEGTNNLVWTSETYGGERGERLRHGTSGMVLVVMLLQHVIAVIGFDDMLEVSMSGEVLEQPHGQHAAEGGCPDVRSGGCWNASWSACSWNRCFGGGVSEAPGGGDRNFYFDVRSDCWSKGNTNMSKWSEKHWISEGTSEFWGEMTLRYWFGS